MYHVYIAGPFRNQSQFQIRRNIINAEQVGLLLAELFGIVPVIPHSMYSAFNGTMSDQYWLDATRDLLLRCDYALFINGWMKSHGCNSELATCKERNIPYGFIGIRDNGTITFETAVDLDDFVKFIGQTD